MPTGAASPASSDEWKRHTVGFKRRTMRAKGLHDAPIPGRQLRRPKEEFERSLKAKLDEYVMTAEGRERVQRCVVALEDVVSALGSKWCVAPFGSAANGFGTKASDLDITCYEELDDCEPQWEQAAAGVLGERLAPLLRKHPEFTITQEVLNARVPILKLCFEGSLEVDLSCRNTLPLQNTRLLEAYASLDDRVRRLGIAVKLWAKAKRVCGASQSHLSSYTLILLVLYFMQVHPKVRLPMLPVDLFKEVSEADRDKRVEAARAAFKCNLSLGELLMRFFQFYCEEFQWGSEVVSTRLASRQHVGEPFYSKLKGSHLNRLHVEDPVDLARNLNCVLGEPEEMQLKNLMKDAFACLMAGKGIPLGYLPEEEELMTTPEDELDLKARSLSQASTASFSGSCTSSTNDRDSSEEPRHAEQGVGKTQGYCVRTAGELEASMMAKVVSKAHEPVAAPRPDKKHELLQLLQGPENSMAELPPVQQNLQSEQCFMPTKSRPISKASRSIAAKVNACLQDPKASMRAASAGVGGPAAWQ
eukprot:TRINITY_DN74585_c0_g1_i1.p1 TRINITY_DN74585_c0_g1~~TRINITY_DN74585_c0_g1_i1.p1  ORF type:complete len:558 (-),score=107.39 TRINITY_DN74585_c0_g1_i1:267-1859(-)